jgi:hypothetical protein
VSDVLRAIAARVEPGMRVAVDGVTASGKTMFADALAPAAVRVTIDDFHRPPPQEYYPDSFDFGAFRAHVADMHEPGETRYLEEVDPESVADVVVENTDFDRPRLRARPWRTP